MKKNVFLILFCCICLVACGGKNRVKRAPAPPVTSKPASPAPTAPPPTVSTTPAPAPEQTPAPQAPATAEVDEPGGYYMDDGPGANPPKNIDSIPNAVPKKEPLYSRTNKPYKALGETYRPMTSYQPYKERGIASWYGKRFHGKKTSNGETYDMYSMTAAHTILPLPSYAKVTNPANGKSVIVRVNDRGPFKHSRIIDLSYAAAYKLGYVNKGSTLVEVEAINPDNISENTQLETKPVAVAEPVKEPAVTANEQVAANTDNSDAITGFFVQVGAFKEESNADALISKLLSLDIDQNSGINKVYNNGLHRLKIGPFETKLGADKTAADIRKRLNVPAITVTK